MERPGTNENVSPSVATHDLLDESLESERCQNTVPQELTALRGYWVGFLVLGIALIGLGTVAIGSAFFVSFATVTLFGALLLTGGVCEVVGSFWTRGWSLFFLHLLSGVFSIVVGLLLVGDPGGALLAMPLLLASFLMVGGVFKTVAVLAQPFLSWGWMVLSGAIDLALGLMIWTEWPWTGLWVIGLFVGINLVLRGWTGVMLAMDLRALPRPAM